MKLTLEFHWGSEAMKDHDDLADVLHKLAGQIASQVTLPACGKVEDDNGYLVGVWEIE